MSNQASMRHSTDRRVLKTRAAIEQAFVDLLDTTEYRKITISAIAQAANINRKTFYLHYSSIDELLDCSVERLANRVVDSVSDCFDWSDEQAALPALSRAILEEFANHARMESNLMATIAMSDLLSMARKPLAQRIERAREDRGLEPIPQVEFLTACYLGALFGAYDVWRDNGCRESLEEVAQLLHTGLGGTLSAILDNGIG